MALWEKTEDYASIFKKTSILKHFQKATTASCWFVQALIRSPSVIPRTPNCTKERSDCGRLYLRTAILEEPPSQPATNRNVGRYFEIALVAWFWISYSSNLRSWGVMTFWCGSGVIIGKLKPRKFERHWKTKKQKSTKTRSRRRSGSLWVVDRKFVARTACAAKNLVAVSGQYESVAPAVAFIRHLETRVKCTPRNKTGYAKKAQKHLQ